MDRVTGEKTPLMVPRVLVSSASSMSRSGEPASDLNSVRSPLTSCDMSLVSPGPDMILNEKEFTDTRTFYLLSVHVYLLKGFVLP